MNSRFTNSSRLVRLESCPRCEGDLHTNRDMYGEYKECLQCGYMADVVKDSHFASLRADPSEIDEVA